MSLWYEPKLEDIEIDPNGEELNIYLTSDDGDYGNIYATIKISDIKAILEIK